MRFYLDDDSVNGVLIKLLRGAGHDVQIPKDVGMIGTDDCVHLTHAVKENRILLSGNHDDFNNLHELISHASGIRPGILIVRRENNPRRDLTPRGIVNAISNLLTARVSIENQLIILNQWR